MAVLDSIRESIRAGNSCSSCSSWSMKAAEIKVKSSLIQPLACLDQGFHVLKPRSFPPNNAPKMREKHRLFVGLRLVSQEFQHPAIQTKIEKHFWRIFSSNKSAPANRKTEFYANHNPNKQEVGSEL